MREQNAASCSDNFKFFRVSRFRNHKELEQLGDAAVFGPLYLISRKVRSPNAISRKRAPADLCAMELRNTGTCTPLNVLGVVFS